MKHMKISNLLLLKYLKTKINHFCFNYFLTFEALELLANDKEFDDRYFIVYNLSNVHEIMLNFHSFISAKLQGNDKLIFNEYSYKFLVFIKNVYYTITINVL